MDQEDLYRTFTRIIESMNVIVATYCDEDGPLGNIQVDPANSTVGFGSGLHGWAFTLKQFAEMYADKFKIEPAKLMKRLWGDHFYCPSQNKWSMGKGEGFIRGFCQFVLDPIYKVEMQNFVVISLNKVYYGTTFLASAGRCRHELQEGRSAETH